MNKVLEKIAYNEVAIISIGIIFLAVLPFLINTSFHNSQRLISTIIITSFLFYSLYTYQGWTEKNLLFTLIFIIIGGLIAFKSLDPLWSSIELMIFLSIFLFIISFAKKIDINKIKLLTLTFSLIQLLYASRALINYSLIIISNEKIDVWVIIDGFDNIRFYAQFLSWTIPFIIGYLASQATTQYRNTLVATVSISFALVLISGTRAFALGMVFTLLAVFIFTPHLWTRYLKYFLVTSIIGAFLYFLMIFIIPYLLGVDNQLALESTINRDFTNSSGRVDIWLQTLNIAISNPWLGIGPMMTAKNEILKGVAHPHNFILQLMAEWGFPFTILFLLLCGYLLYKWKQLISQNHIERETLALPITAATSSAFTASLVDGIMVMPVSLTYMAIIVGFGISLVKAWSPPVANFKISLLTRLVLIAPAFLLLVFTVYQWTLLDLKNQNNGNLAPRFWSDGKLN